MSENDFLRKKALFLNLRSVKSYFLKNLNRMTAVVKKIDESIPTDTVWSSEEIGEFLFVGKSRAHSDVYKVDLYDGTVVKNGTAISGVPKDIKNHHLFQKIF